MHAPAGGLSFVRYAVLAIDQDFSRRVLDLESPLISTLIDGSGLKAPLWVGDVGSGRAFAGIEPHSFIPGHPHFDEVSDRALSAIRCNM